jgi:hypothetical protein
MKKKIGRREINLDVVAKNIHVCCCVLCFFFLSGVQRKQWLQKY